MICALTSTAQAEEPTGLNVSLISENSTIFPGEPFTVGLHIKHHEGYHTYWKNPGIVGVATTITWQLPDGFTASGIRWPHPELTKMASHPCHGYERDVTLLVTITPPKSLTQKEVTLHSAAAWMCCSDTCYPGSTKLSLTLNVGAEKSIEPSAAKLLRKARQEIPLASKAWTSAMLTAPDAKTIRIKITPPTGTAMESVYLFSCDGQISSNKRQTVSAQPDGSWILTTERCEFSPKKPSQLSAVLKVGKQHIIIYPKYPK